MEIRFAAGLLLCMFAQNAQADLVTRWNVTSHDGNATTIAADSGPGIVVLEQNGASLLEVSTGASLNAFGLEPAGSAPPLDGEDADLVFNAALAVSNSSFASGLVSYSLDGLADTGLSVDPSMTASSNPPTVDLSGHSILDDQVSLFNNPDSLGLLPEPSTLALTFAAAALVLPFVRLRKDKTEAVEPPKKASPPPVRMRKQRPVFKQRFSDIFGWDRSSQTP